MKLRYTKYKVFNRLLSAGFFLFFLCSCGSGKNLVTSQEQPFEISFDREVKMNSNFRLTLRNTGSDTIIIHHPDLKHIEKFNSGQWNKVRILHCPCNANCIKPPATKILVNEQEYILLWNLMEGWCGQKNKEGIKPTFENLVEEGLYRVVLNISYKGVKQTLYKEFKVLSIN